MSQFLLCPVFFPFLAGPFAYWIGCWYEKARNTFVMSAAALELFLVLTLWTKPELAQATAAVEGFCGLGIQLRDDPGGHDGGVPVRRPVYRLSLF